MKTHQPKSTGDAFVPDTDTQQQLAAERRAVEVEINEGVAARDINHLNRIDDLEKQLDAERERADKAEQKLNDLQQGYRRM